MASSNFENIKKRALEYWTNLSRKSNEEEIASMGRERIVVFIVAFILAICLWFMVNLTQRYTLNVDLPIERGALPDDRALTRALPQNATISVSGEGWKLINIFNNPPPVTVDVMKSEINLYDQVRQQLNTFSEIEVQKVQPLMITLSLEARHSKRVPVRALWDISFKNQHGFIDTPDLQPDSITISGAASLLDSITEWPTDTLYQEQVSSSIEEMVPLKENDLISLSQQRVYFSGEVAQYTEGETNVMLSTRNLPLGQTISYSPTSVTVRFDVPIDEYADIENQPLFEAYVSYGQLQEDSTGFVKPRIDQITNNKHIKIRSFQPKEVAYFMVVSSE